MSDRSARQRRAGNACIVFLALVAQRLGFIVDRDGGFPFGWIASASFSVSHSLAGYPLDARLEGWIQSVLLAAFAGVMIFVAVDSQRRLRWVLGAAAVWTLYVVRAMMEAGWSTGESGIDWEALRLRAIVLMVGPTGSLIGAGLGVMFLRALGRR